MKNQNIKPFKSLNGQNKDKHFGQQMQRVFTEFQKQPATMKMVSIETNIDRANICRYIRIWRKECRIFEIKKGICPITKHRAGFLTTNPMLFNSHVEPLKKAQNERL